MITKATDAAIEAAALDYLQRRWVPVPVYGPNGAGCTCDKGRNCASPGKHPILDQWQLQTPDESTIRQWYAEHPDANVGVQLGPRSGIIDIETDSEDGEAWIADLWGGSAPATATFRSGRKGGGGLHRLYLYRDDLPAKGHKGVKWNGQHVGDLKLGCGVSEETGEPLGTQCVFPPSMHKSGRRYEWVFHPDENPPAELPDYVAEKLRILCNPPPAVLTPPPILTITGAVERCRKYLAKMPPAISGQHGHDRTFNAACECFKFGLSDGEALSLLIEYSAKCVPPWSERELQHKLEGAKQQVMAAGQFGFRLIETPPVGRVATVAAKPEAKPTPIVQYVPFPVGELPATTSEFIEAAADSISVDPCKVAVAVLVTASGAIGNSCRVKPKPDYSEPAMIWAGSVAKSGERKSPPFDEAGRPIRRRDGAEIQKFHEAMAAHDEAVIKHKAAMRAWEKEQSKGTATDPPEAPQPPIERRFVVEDTTVEKLAAMLQANPRGVVQIRDELAGFFQGQNQYKSGSKGSDESDYLAIFGGRQWRKDRKAAGGSVFVPMPFVAIGGTVQPEILRRCLTRDRLESGMAARFLFAWPPSRKATWNERYVDAALQDRYGSMIDRLLSIPLNVDAITGEPLPEMLSLSPAAKSLWVPWHDRQEEERLDLDGPLAAAWSKLTGYALRLALVVELLRWAETRDWQPPGAVSEASMAAGIALSEWFSVEARRVYGVLSETDEQRERRELVEYIGGKGGSITERDMSRSGPRGYRNDPDGVAKALQRLVTAGDGEWSTITPSAGGHSFRVFRLTRGYACPENLGKASASVSTQEIETDEEDYSCEV